MLADYAKPLSISSLKNAGIPFELIIWDNNKKNIGLNAYDKMANLTDKEYLVTLDNDVTWFKRGWLKNLFEAFHDAPWIYHECGPYYNKKYEKIWKKTHEGQTIKEAIVQYRELDPSLRFR